MVLKAVSLETSLKMVNKQQFMTHPLITKKLA
jgi:hypothetical protein